jgi:hypothetical protein
MLGALRGRLGKEDDPACRLVHTSISPALRNAEAHDEWSWDSTSDEVVGYGENAGIRITLDELHDHVEQLGGCICGLEATLACFTVDHDVAFEADWLAQGRAPDLRSDLAHIILSGFEVPVTELLAEGRTLRLVVEGPGRRAHGLWGPCVALIGSLYKDVDRVEVVSAGSGLRLLDVGRKAVERYRREDKHKDLSQFYVLMDVGCRAARPPTEVLGDSLVLMLHLIEQLDISHVLPAFQAGDLRPIGNLRERLSVVERICLRYRRHWNAAIETCVDCISAARVAALEAQSNDFDALVRFTQALSATDEFKAGWVSEHGAPPTLFERLERPPVGPSGHSA